jgi:hypothetical protein
MVRKPKARKVPIINKEYIWELEVDDSMHEFKVFVGEEECVTYQDGEECKRLKIMNKTQMQGQAQVAISLRTAGEGTWRFFAVTADASGRELPVTISALTYNPINNTWSSAHGELTPTEFKATDDFIFKAQSGTEWKLEKQDSFVKTVQSLRITKSTDGKSVFVAFASVERDRTTNQTLSQQGYTLLFPVQQAQMNIGKPGSK